MGEVKMRKEIIIRVVLIFLLGIAMVYYVYFFKPKDSLELYQSIRFSDDYEEVLKLMVDGHEAGFPRETYEAIQNIGYGPREIHQFTLFRYVDKTFLIMTTPGGARLRVFKVEELPKEVREYFLEISP